MKLICVVSPKGGDGTTLVAANLAYALALHHGTCLAADMNTHRRTLDLTLGVSDKIIFDIGDVIADTCDIDDAIIKTEFANLDFVTSSQTAEVDEDFCAKALGKILQTVKYDYIIADIPYSFVKTVLPLCDMMIFVSSPSQASVRCLAAACAETDCFEKTHLIINKIIPELIENNIWNNADDICDTCGIVPLGFIPFEPEAEIIQSRGTPAASKTVLKLSQAIGNIAKRISGEKVCSVDFDYKSPYYKVFKKFI